MFSRANATITESFISSIIKEPVKNVELDVATNLLRNNVEDKLGIVDFRAKLDNGTYCNIEIQLVSKGAFIKRLLYYWAKLYSEQIHKSEDYNKLPRTISIAILNFELKELKDIDKYYTNWKLYEESYKKRPLTPILNFIIIELPKLIKLKEKDIDDELVQWMMFLDNPRSMEVKKIMEKNVNVKEAVKEFKDITQEEYDAYLKRVEELKEKARLDEISWKNHIKREAMAQGEIKGEIKGENKKQKEIVQNMLQEKLDIELIAKITGLSIKEIKELEKNKK